MVIVSDLKISTKIELSILLMFDYDDLTDFDQVTPDY